MEIRDPEPQTENVLDLDFFFVGNVQSSITLQVDKGDSIDWGVISAAIHKGEEDITVYRENLLYYSRRNRKRLLPVPKGSPVTATIPAVP